MAAFATEGDDVTEHIAPKMVPLAPERIELPCAGTAAALPVGDAPAESGGGSPVFGLSNAGLALMGLHRRPRGSARRWT